MPSTTRTDTDDRFPWAQRVTVVDANGLRISETTTFDDGRVLVRTYHQDVLTQVAWTDPSNAKSWLTRTETFDPATGHILDRTTVMDDGRSITLGFENGVRSTQQILDLNNAAAYERITTTYDAAGLLSEVVQLSDDGRISTTSFTSGVRTHKSIEDAADSALWARKDYAYDPATGKLTSVTTVSDDAQTEIQLSFAKSSGEVATRVDTEDKYSWQETTETRDARGELASRARLFDDGRSVTETFVDGVRARADWIDGGDAAKWASQTHLFDSAGRFATKSQIMDDGRSITVTYAEGVRRTFEAIDLEGNFAWTTQSKRFDEKGRLVETAISYDDGRQATTRFVEGIKQSQTIVDQGDAYAWQAISQTFAGPGGTKLSVQRVFDDGEISLRDGRGQEIIAGGTEASVTEDAAALLEAAGAVQFEASYSGSTRFVAVDGAAGTAGLGHFTLDANGTWHYSAQNAQAQIQALADGETLTDSLMVQTEDGVQTQLRVTIEGVSDGPAPIYLGGPIIAFGQAGDLAPAAPTLDLGQLFTDEQGDALTITASSLPAKYSLEDNILSFTNPADAGLINTAGDAPITLTATDATGQITDVAVTLATGQARSYGDFVLSFFSDFTYTSGDELLTFGTGAGENGRLVTRLGAGADSASFGAFAADDGEMTVEAGTGDDSITFGDDAGRSTDGFGLGDLVVDLGQGDDLLSFGARAGQGGSGISVLAGTGADDITFGDGAQGIEIDLGTDTDADRVAFAGAMDSVTILNWTQGEDVIALTGSNGGMWARSDVAGDARFTRFDGSNFTIAGAAGVATADLVAGLSENTSPTSAGLTDPVTAGSLGSEGSLAFDLASLFSDADAPLGDSLQVTLENVPLGFAVTNNILTAITPSDLTLAGDYTVRATATDLHGATHTQDVTLRMVVDHDFDGDHGSDPFVVLGSLGDDAISIPGSLRYVTPGGTQPFGIEIDTRAGDDAISIASGLDTVSQLSITDLAGSTTLTIGDRLDGFSPATTIALSQEAEAFSTVTIGDGFADDGQAHLSGRGSFTFGADAAGNFGAITLDVAGDVTFGAGAGAHDGAIEVLEGSLGARDMTFGTGAQNLTLSFGALGEAETLTFEGSVDSTTIVNLTPGEDRIAAAQSGTYWSAFDVGADKLFLDDRGSNFTVLGAAGLAADLLAPGLVAPGQDRVVQYKAMADSFTIGEEQELSGSLLDNDLLAGLPAHVTLLDQGSADGRLEVQSDGSFTFTTNRDDLWAGYRETVQFIYGITTPDGLTSQATADITIEGQNDAPVMADAEMEVFDSVLGPGPGGTYVLDLSSLGNDPDGDDNGQTLTYTVTRGDAAGFLTTMDGTDLRVFPGVTWRYLDGGTSKTHDLEITATDQHGASTTATVTLNVIGADNPVRTNHPGYAILEDQESVFDVLAAALTVDESDTFELKEVIGAQHGSAVIDNGMIRYTPYQDFWGTDTIRYTIVDSDGIEASGFARVRIDPVPDAPHISLQTIGSRNGGDFAVVVRAETTDFEEEPDNNFVGIDRFEVVARDADGNLIDNLEDYVTTEWDTPLKRTKEAFTFHFNLPDGGPTDWDIEIKAVAKNLNGLEAEASETLSIEFDTSVHRATQTFDIASQNIWNSPDGARFTASETFGGSFNEAGGTTLTLTQFDHRLLGVGVSTHFSTRLDGSASGSIGLTASTGITGGQVSGTAAFDTSVKTTALTADDSTLLTFYTQAWADPSAASFNASSPKLDFDLSVTELDFYASFAARLWGYLHFHLGYGTVKPIDRGKFYDGWAFGADLPLDANPLLGSNGRSIVNFDGVDTIQFLEFGPTTQNLNGNYTDPLDNRLLDYALGNPNFSNSATGSAGSLLSGQKSEVFADLTLDLDSIAASILGKKNPLGFIKQESQGPLSYGYHYDLLDLDVSLQAAYRQANSLDLGSLDGTVIFEDGTEADFTFGQKLGFINAEQYDQRGNNDGIIQYDIAMRPTARFNSDAYLDMSIFDTLRILGASVNGGVTSVEFGGVSTPSFGINKSVGPLYSHRGLLIDESQSITLAQRSFELETGTTLWEDLFI